MIRKIFLLTIILCSLGSTCLAFMQKEPEPVLRIRAIDVPKEATVRVMGSQDQWECLYLGEYRIRVNIAEYDEETKTLNVAAHILKYKSKFVCVDEFTLKEKEKRTVNVGEHTIEYAFSVESLQPSGILF